MDTLKKQVQALTQDDWGVFLGWVVGEERDRRDSLSAVEQARTDDMMKLWEVHPDLKPKFAEGTVDVKPAKAGVTVTKAELVKAYPAWKAPSGAHDALPTGALVAHKGEVWRTDLPVLNVWEPESGNPHTQWVKVTDELLAEANKGTTPAGQDAPTAPAAPEFKQPSGGHDAYKVGDRVTFNGAVYESTINGNVWSPEAHAQGWKKL